MKKETMKGLVLQVLTNEPKKASEIIELVGCETEYNKFCEVLSDLIVEQKIDWVVGGYVLAKEKAEYAIIVGAGYAIRLLGKTEDEAREMYEQTVKEYKDMPVRIYKIYNPYE